MKLGWLGPDGNLIECSYLEHVATAEEYLNSIGAKYKHADEEMLNRGFAQISVSLLGKKEAFIYWRGFLTDYQKNYIVNNENDIDWSLGTRIMLKKEGLI